jgi:serine/threonine-protein kinase RsbT
MGSEFIWLKDGVDPAKIIECRRAGGDAIEIERDIRGGDFAKVGAGASEIKKIIKKLAISPPVMRRAAIACFEAEVNVTVYAETGNIKARVTPLCIYVVVRDHGPGIPDIEQAMEPGWTTATPEVREMGFGAGLGLPNIRSNVDYLKITAEVGVGTGLEFVIFL